MLIKEVLVVFWLVSLVLLHDDTQSSLMVYYPVFAIEFQVVTAVIGTVAKDIF